MKTAVLVVVIGLMSGCALLPAKQESEWKGWEDIREGGSREAAVKAMGSPLDTAMLTNGQEILIWNNGCGVRLEAGKIAATSCNGEYHRWDMIGEGSSLAEVAYFVGLSGNVEPATYGKIFHYAGRGSRCALGIAADTKRVVMRRCESTGVNCQTSYAFGNAYTTCY